MMRFPAAWTLWMTVVCLLLSGCGSSANDHGNGDDMSPEHIAALENELRSKPSFETAQAQYQAAVGQTADAIVALIPGARWRFDDNTWRGCGGKYVRTRGVRVYQALVIDKPIPEDKWGPSLQIVKDMAERLHARDVTTLVDKPGNHDVVISNADGVEFEFGTAVNTILSAKSDCRLRQTDLTASSTTPHP